MDQLKNIVGTSGLRQDIKRVRKAESLRGATKWAQKHSTSKTQYNAREEDIDGDGIQDVLVETQDGNLVIVNGYTVRKSDYPYRQMFGELPKSVREQHGNYKRYLKDLYGEPTIDPATGETKWPEGKGPDSHELYRKLSEHGFSTYKPRPEVASVYQLFTKEITKPLVNEVLMAEPEKYSYRATDKNGKEVVKYPPVVIEVSADAWNYCVVKPIIELVTGQVIENDSPVQLKELFARGDIVRFKKTREFKERSSALVRQYIENDPDVEELTNKLMERIDTDTDIAARDWLSKHKGYFTEWMAP